MGLPARRGSAGALASCHQRPIHHHPTSTRLAQILVIGGVGLVIGLATYGARMGSAGARALGPAHACPLCLPSLTPSPLPLPAPCCQATRSCACWCAGRAGCRLVLLHATLLPCAQLHPLNPTLATPAPSCGQGVKMTRLTNSRGACLGGTGAPRPGTAALLCSCATCFAGSHAPSQPLAALSPPAPCRLLR